MKKEHRIRNSLVHSGFSCDYFHEFLSITFTLVYSFFSLLGSPPNKRLLQLLLGCSSHAAYPCLSVCPCLSCLPSQLTIFSLFAAVQATGLATICDLCSFQICCPRPLAGQALLFLHIGALQASSSVCWPQAQLCSYLQSQPSRCWGGFVWTLPHSWLSSWAFPGFSILDHAFSVSVWPSSFPSGSALTTVAQAEPPTWCYSSLSRTTCMVFLASLKIARDYCSSFEAFLSINTGLVQTCQSWQFSIHLGYNHWVNLLENTTLIVRIHNSSTCLHSFLLTK